MSGINTVDVSGSQTSQTAVMAAAILVAFAAIPVSFVLSAIDGVLNPEQLTGAIAFIMLALTGLAYYVTIRKLPKAWHLRAYVFFFTMFSFAAVADLLIALTLVGLTDVMNHYFESGEPYLQSGYGFAANAWDGTIHLALYMWLIWHLARGQLPVRSGLFWAGSILCSLFVYMPGSVTGPWAEEIESSYALNVVFMVVPIFFAARLLGRPPHDSMRRVFAPAWFMLPLFIVLVLTAYRLLVGLNADISITRAYVSSIEPYVTDSSMYPKITLVAMGHLLSIMLVVLLFTWRRGVSRTVHDWTWLVAGFAAQGSFAQLAGAWQVLGNPGSIWLWLINLLVPLVIVVAAILLDRAQQQ